MSQYSEGQKTIQDRHTTLCVYVIYDPFNSSKDSNCPLLGLQIHFCEKTTIAGLRTNHKEKPIHMSSTQRKINRMIE